MAVFIPFFISVVAGAAVLSLIGLAVMMKIDGEPIWPHVRDKANRLWKMVTGFWDEPYEEKRRLARQFGCAVGVGTFVVIGIVIFVPGLAAAQPLVLPSAFVVTAAMAKITVFDM